MISCLLVTLSTPQRAAYARRSIDAYCRQTHADRELVVVVDRTAPDGGDALAAYIESLGREDIRIVIAADRLRLGGLRNLSVEAARGDVICQWDDDDLYHPQRLEAQYALLVGGDYEAVYLQELMQYYPERRALYSTNWRATPVGGLPGTLMAHRTAPLNYPENGATSMLGEDTEVALALIARGRVGYVRDAPHIHIYVSHGANTYDDSHHLMLTRELSVSKALLQRREAALRAGLMPFALPADSIDVIGSNGTAFRL